MLKGEHVKQEEIVLPQTHDLQIYPREDLHKVDPVFEYSVVMATIWAGSSVEKTIKYEWLGRKLPRHIIGR